MKQRAGVVFSLALVVLFAGTIVAALGFRRQAQLFPMVIGVVGLGLATAQLAMEIRGLRARPSGPLQAQPENLLVEEEPLLTQNLPTRVLVRRTAAVMGWIVAFTGSIWFLGFPLAVPLASFAYLRFGARESWALSSIFAAALGAVFYGLFVNTIRIPFEEGMLWLLLPPAEEWLPFLGS